MCHADIDLGDALANNVKRCKYTKPTPVQKYSIPIGLSGRDLMACAQTGSGKTAAFCFPIIANILKRGQPPAARSRKAYPQALVLSPTRELSSQIYDEARKFTYQTGLRCVVVYGGAPVVNQVSLIWLLCFICQLTWHMMGHTSSTTLTGPHLKQDIGVSAVHAALRLWSLCCCIVSASACGAW